MTADGGTGGSLEAAARWTAAVRAKEHERGDRLSEDPWAAALAGPEGAAWIADSSPDSVIPIVIRTRFFDEWIASVLDDGRRQQVELLAAGRDTRAYVTAERRG